MTTIYDFSVKTIDGHEQSLADYRGQALLVVNVASKCGFTPQYTGLEALYRRHHDEGFSVLGFPCDQFLHQEPGDDAEIKNFCSLKYDVTFPLFAKVNVNGPATRSAISIPEVRPPRPVLDAIDQVELHQVPDRPRRQRAAPLRPARDAGTDRSGREAGAGPRRLSSIRATVVC